jgi:Ca-activated chloride channel family protein
MGLITTAAVGCLQAESRVKVITDVDRPVVLAGSDERIFVKVGLSAIDTGRRPDRLPFNLAIVLDKSGSMRSDGKIENAKRGAIEIIERLGRDDIISLIVYDNGPWVVLPAQHVRDKEYLIDRISHIQAGGRTALYGGVTYGAGEVRKHLSWKYMNRIILLSDGLANVGPSSTTQLARLGGSLGEEGITVTTIGVGLDYNEDLMTALADGSGGNAYFASTGAELPRIFSEEVGEAMTLAARDVRIRLDCNRGVRPISVLGREGEVSDESISVTVGKLYGKNDKYALFEVQVPGAAGGDQLDIARVTVEYADPYSNESRTESQTVSIEYHGDQKVVDESVSKSIVKDVALTRTSEVKRQAVSLADQGDFRAAANLLKQNALELENVAEQCDKDEEILKEAVVGIDMSRSVETNMGFTRGGRKRAVNEAYTQTRQQGYVSDGKQDEKKDDTKE